VDAKVARFLYACGVPFNVLRSPYWHDLVKEINEAPKGYKSPNYEKARTVLLDMRKNPSGAIQQDLPKTFQISLEALSGKPHIVTLVALPQLLLQHFGQRKLP
jgi:hypothetical protein